MELRIGPLCIEQERSPMTRRTSTPQYINWSYLHATIRPREGKRRYPILAPRHTNRRQTFLRAEPQSTAMSPLLFTLGELDGGSRYLIKLTLLLAASTAVCFD
jgi:hypothetical protein